jgi:hypothetical protein
MADLANLGETYTPDEAFDVELRGPDGAQLFNDDGSAMTIGVLGADSDVAVKARNASANRRIQAGPRAKVTAEGIDSDANAYLAKLSVRWNITMGGEKPAFSYDAALKLYANPRLSFIREQVDAAIGERSNFLKA